MFVFINHYFLYICVRNKNIKTMRHSFLLMLILTLLLSLHSSTISAQDEYDKQDDCTFALQMYDGDELLSQVLLDAVDSTGHPYAYILVNGRVWDPDYKSQEYLTENNLCRCAYGQYPFTFFPTSQIKNERTSRWDNSWFFKYNNAKDELRYYYFKRSRRNPFALYIFDGKDLYYSTDREKDGNTYIAGDGHFQVYTYYNGTDEIEGYEIKRDLDSRDNTPQNENIAYWDNLQKRINNFRFIKGTPETLSINTLKPDKTNIALMYNKSTKELQLYGTDKAIVRIYTPGGQMYREYNYSKTLFLTDLPHGIYIAKAITEGGETVVKSIAI